VNPAKLKTVDIRKEFPGTVALDGISVDFHGGDVHALIGKNGAGKSTLVKILAGALQPTGGKLIINGREVRLGSPQDAFRKGIATVYQELTVVPELTVAENILLGRLPKRKTGGGLLIDWPAVFVRAKEVLDDLEVDIDPKAKAGQLPVAKQQVVEIAKAMSFNPSALMLDEPTSALAHHETENLFKLIRKLAEKQVAIIYITHRLGELAQIADKVTVLRDGRHIGTADIKQTSPERIVEMMFGQVVPKKRPRDVQPEKKTLMEISGLSSEGNFRDVNFTLYEGEILGIAGMLGSGRTELLKGIFGALKFQSGYIRLGDRKITSANPQLMKRLGVAFTPENRNQEGLIQLLSARENMCLAGLEKISRHGFITKKRERQVVRKFAEDLDIKLSDPEQPISSLSGGNQQKVVVGNWLNIEPRLMLLDEPTRGIDVRAKQQIFQVMWNLSRRKISCIFVSSELEELPEVCHRILIMKKGQITKQVYPRDVSANELFLMCMEE